MTRRWLANYQGAVAGLGAAAAVILSSYRTGIQARETGHFSGLAARAAARERVHGEPYKATVLHCARLDDGWDLDTMWPELPFPFSSRRW